MTTKREIEQISKIARAAQATLSKRGATQDIMSLMMDVEFIHEQAPLRLGDMVNDGLRQTADFVHDILGIYAHWNRDTKEMEDCFVPRFTL